MRTLLFTPLQPILGDNDGQQKASAQFRHHVVHRADIADVVKQACNIRCVGEASLLPQFLRENGGSLLCVVCSVPASGRGPVIITDTSLVQAELWLWDTASDWLGWLSTGDVISIRGGRRRGSGITVSACDRILLVARLPHQQPSPAPAALALANQGRQPAQFTFEQLVTIVRFAHVRFSPRPLVEPQAKPVPVCTVRQLMGPHPPAQARLRGHIVRVRTGRGELVYVACMLCHAALNKDANGVYQMCEECAGCVDERAGQCEWVYRPWTLEVTDASDAGGMVHVVAEHYMVRDLLLHQLANPADMHFARIQATMQALCSPCNTTPFLMHVRVTAATDENGFQLAVPEIALQALTLFPTM